MRVSTVTAVLLTALAAFAALAQSTTAKKPAPKPSAKSAAPVKPGPTKASPAKASAAKSSKSKASTKTASSKSAASKTPARYRRASQAQPSAQRYREIQQALADKGYFEGAVDGNWGPSSAEALKRFQREQNLADDGKLSSLSLIGLGLGPQRAAAEPSSPIPAVPQQ